jgi:hypothetical protein
MKTYNRRLDNFWEVERSTMLTVARSASETIEVAKSLARDLEKQKSSAT